MDQAELLETWRREEVQPFSGWDFSYLDGRMICLLYTSRGV